MRVRWEGHSTVTLELDDVVLLTDPLLRGRVAHLRRHAEVPALPASLDAILLSHLHADHLDIPSLRLLPASTPMIVPRGAGALLRRRTRRRVVELAPGEETLVGGVLVRAVQADHAAGRHPLARRIGAIGFVVEGSQSVYFAGDTDLFDEMESLSPALDLALVPIWGWGSTAGPGHLDPVRAAQALALLRPRVAVPIHWGTYRVIGTGPGVDPAEPADRFLLEAAQAAPTVDVRVLQPGESLDL